MDSQINFSNSTSLSEYGVGIQKNLAKYSEDLLSQVRNKDTGEVGTMLNQLMLTVKGIDLDKINNPGALSKVWNKFMSEISLYKGHYEKVNDQMSALVHELEESKTLLLDQNAKLEKIYEGTVEYYKELEDLLENGEIALKKRHREIALVEAKDQLTAQMLKDEHDKAKTFEKRLHDLKLTRMMTLQSLPQIRLIQHNNDELINKIQSSLLNTIPIWKNQLVLALSMEKQKKAASVQKKISETTNNLLSSNSELLKANSIQIAQLSEQGIIETSTLQKMNDNLTSMIAEMLKVYHEGREKRIEADKELQEMERKLKASLAV